MDETVIGAASARWMTTGMKREDGMQGSQSEAVDERGRSLIMADGVGVSTSAEEDGGGWGGGRRRLGWRGCFGAHGVRMRKWRERGWGEPCLQGALVSNARKFTNVAPI